MGFQLSLPSSFCRRALGYIPAGSRIIEALGSFRQSSIRQDHEKGHPRHPRHPRDPTTPGKAPPSSLYHLPLDNATTRM